MFDAQFYVATVVNLSINLVYTILALWIGLKAFHFSDDHLFPDIDFMKEIKAGNIAASMFACTKLFFIAFVIGFALRG